MLRMSTVCKAHDSCSKESKVRDLISIPQNSVVHVNEDIDVCTVTQQENVHVASD